MVDCDEQSTLKSLEETVELVPGPAGEDVRVVSDRTISRLAATAAGRAGGAAVAAGEAARAKRRVELLALEAGLCPRRYLRNLGTLGLQGQARLLEAKVGLAGLGGLGGTVAEILARAGVGELVVIDPDVTSEDNLNRQALAAEDNLGQTKVAAAVERLRRLNSATTVSGHALAGDRASFAALFTGAGVLVDALDTLGARFALQDAAAELGVPFVHGAIAGLAGQVTTIFPGDPGLELIYGPRDRAPGRGVETRVGNLSPTPAMVAAAEAQEVIKLLAGVGQPLRRRLLVLDLYSPYAAVVEL